MSNSKPEKQEKACPEQSDESASSEKSSFFEVEEVVSHKQNRSGQIAL
jgi:hypothetical protein